MLERPAATAVDLSSLIRRVSDGEHLGVDEAREAFRLFMRGEASPVLMGALLTALRTKSVVASELAGGVMALAEAVIPVPSEDPGELVDEAFLRRIRHKLKVDNPDEKTFYMIMQRECAVRGMQLPADVFVHLMQKHYIEENRPLRACHPRDLVDQIYDIATYLGQPPVMSRQLLDAACEGYFADL